MSAVLSAEARLGIDISEFTQQDGKKKRTAKRLCLTNVTAECYYLCVLS